MQDKYVTIVRIGSEWEHCIRRIYNKTEQRYMFKLTKNIKTGGKTAGQGGNGKKRDIKEE